MSEATAKRVLQRFILPIDRDLDVVPLYVDTEPAMLDADKEQIGTNQGAQKLNKAAARQAISAGTSLHPDAILDRSRLRVESGQRLSLGSYFNAFPAGYWRRWTIVEQVELELTISGVGANVIVYRSMANGRSQRVDGWTCTSAEPASASFTLSLVPFVDGGWYWFDVVAGDEPATIEAATWSAQVPAERAEMGTATIGITTMNRPEFCAELLCQLGEDADVRAVSDQVLVMEQGTQKVADHPRFADAQALLGQRLRVIEQGNIGGSGGFARAQFESRKAGISDYVLFLDDDIVAEPESIIRAITFADLATRPSIVGGHMFSIYARSELHSFGEIVNRYRFWWMSPKSAENQWDFGARNLRSSRWLHRRLDVDFNPWFMCLIPLSVVEEIGLSLPLFIKWDDSEYGVRAQSRGFPTITLPGAAVWHVPWTDKNDALDWQAYFHHRNRFIAALLHSPFKHGGRLIFESLNHQIKHLIAMQYSTVELRHRALEDALAGPDNLHAWLPRRLGEIRQLQTQFDDARTSPDPNEFPPVRSSKPRRKADTSEIPSRLSQLVTAVVGGVRQFRAPRGLSREFPEANIPAMDARWYHLAGLDSAIVSMPDGTAAAFYRRDDQEFRRLLAHTLKLHQELYRRWPQLSAQYRAALDEVTSMEAWEATFAAATPSSTAAADTEA